MTSSNQPVRYEPSMEHPESDESETAQGIIETMRSISETTFKDYGHAVRSVHAKSHGILRGTVSVLDDLPPVLAQGLAAQPGRTFEAVMRLSTNPGDILDDNVSTPRGFALKLIGVEGDRLPGSEGAVTQDFVLVNGPAFFTANAKSFLRGLKLLAASTDRAEGLKKAFSFVARNAEAALEALGTKSATLISLGGQPETHILGETFYSQVPILWGDWIAKVSVAPLSPALQELTDAPVDLSGRPNGLREAVMAFFAEHGAEWELRVQLCTDLATMPIEDASKLWDEDASPFRAVARIRVEPQAGWSDTRAAAVDDGLSFSPWHGLAAHRPLGSIMRVRKSAYEAGMRFRAEHNGRSLAEPTSSAVVPEG